MEAFLALEVDEREVKLWNTTREFICSDWVQAKEKERVEGRGSMPIFGRWTQRWKLQKQMPKEPLAATIFPKNGRTITRRFSHSGDISFSDA
jgi:hypothetical protein